MVTVVVGAGGAVAGSSTLTRTTSCVIEDGLLVIFLVPSGEVIGSIKYTITRSATFETTNMGVGSIWNVSAGWKHRFHNPYWVNGYTAFEYSTPATHRCDNTLGANTSPGCTFPSVRPTLDVSFSRYPTYARHIGLSLDYGLPSVLTRTTSEPLRTSNYSRACPTGPNYPRPTGFSCDEYPFQSTYEGATSQPYGRKFWIFNFPLGRVVFDCKVPWLPIRTRGDSGGYSSCMIPVSENSLGGRDLQDFYYRYRVIDRDKFVVRRV